MLWIDICTTLLLYMCKQAFPRQLAGCKAHMSALVSCMGWHSERSGNQKIVCILHSKLRLSEVSQVEPRTVSCSQLGRDQSMFQQKTYQVLSEAQNNLLVTWSSFRHSMRSFWAAPSTFPNCQKWPECLMSLLDSVGDLGARYLMCVISGLFHLQAVMCFARILGSNTVLFFSIFSASLNKLWIW